MSIEWGRDLVIIIFGSVATILMLVGAVLAYQRYRESKALIDSMKALLRSRAMSAAEEVARPVAELVALIQAIRYFVGLFSGKEEEK